MADIVALVFEGKPLIMYRTNELTDDQLDEYRLREAHKRHVPVDDISVCFETPSTEEFVQLRSMPCGNPGVAR